MFRCSIRSSWWWWYCDNQPWAFFSPHIVLIAPIVNHCVIAMTALPGTKEDIRQRMHKSGNYLTRVMLSVPRDLKRVVETKQEGSNPAPNSKYHNRNKSLYTLVTEMELKFALVIRQFYQCQSEIPIANKDTTCQPILSWSQTTL